MGARIADPKIIPQRSIDLQGFGKLSAKAKRNQKPTIPNATSEGTHVSNQLKIFNKSLNTSKRSPKAFLMDVTFQLILLVRVPNIYF